MKCKAIVNRLSEERRQEVLDFAVFCVRGSYKIDCRGDPPHTINIAQPLILSGRPASGKLFGI
ncbi:hypothetical protein [Coleofasciculus sp.]|uniref:hypothetical protein n=1 Tax=Coleofasciculus sp. TaxID=3100458 RepID=UPI003A2F3A07